MNHGALSVRKGLLRGLVFSGIPHGTNKRPGKHNPVSILQLTEMPSQSEGLAGDPKGTGTSGCQCAMMLAASPV